MVDIGSLEPGKYTVSVRYSLNIPPSYGQEIADLEKKYGIELTMREKNILGMYPIWSTRGVVYAPNKVSIGQLQ